MVGGQTMPAPVTAVVANNELVMHGWDLARATGQEFAVAPANLEASWQMVLNTPEDPAARQGLFGPVIPQPDDAPLLDRTLGRAGRDPACHPRSMRLAPAPGPGRRGRGGLGDRAASAYAGLWRVSVPRRPASERTVALTFDDGPNEPLTSRLLQTLASQRDVRPTFFQVGRCAERHPDATRRVVDGGHVLGNHSYSHSLRSYFTQPEPAGGDRTRPGGPAPYLRPGAAASTARPGCATGRGCCARSPRRAPGRCPAPSAPRGRCSSLRRADQRPARWTRTRPGSILIFHDGREARGGPREQTVAAIGPLIDRLRDLGYTFTTVDRMLGVPAYG